MSESKLEEEIKFLGGCLKEKGLKVSKIILFGSHAKGKMIEESYVEFVISGGDIAKK